MDTSIKIIGFDNYTIYEDGRVWSKWNGGRFMSSTLNRDGYMRVGLRNKGKLKGCSVHRLVAMHFVKGHFPELQVNHLDGNKTNNHFKNLEWVTAKENKKHSIDTLGKHSRGSKNGGAKLTDEKVKLIRGLLKVNIPKMQIAKMFNVSRRTILRIEDGVHWVHVPKC